MIEKTKELEDFTRYLEQYKVNLSDDGSRNWLQATIEAAGRSTSITNLVEQFPTPHGYGDAKHNGFIFNIMFTLSNLLKQELQD